MTKLRVGIFDQFFRPGDPSITWQQRPPEDWEWVDNCDDPARADVAMATWGSWDRLLASKHPRRVLYLQETREARPHPPAAIMDAYDLVLSNDEEVASRPNGAWATLFGIRMPPEHYATVPVKSKPVSLMGSMNQYSSGHQLRWRVYRECGPLAEAFGFQGEKYWKRDSLAPFRFQVAIESANYPSWATEKLWDAFALETVPIYWGGITDAKLEEWGFDPSGILRFDKLSYLKTMLEYINKEPEAFYWLMRGAVAHNRKRVLELPCGEVALRKILLTRWPELKGEEV